LEPGAKAKVAANLPYHLTTPIITSLVPLNDSLESLTLMVQKEVAERFTANTGTSEYSSITLFLKYHAQVKSCFTIEPTCFFPKPKVRSAVVQFQLKAPEQEMPASFFSMVRTAFQQRRKMLRGSLRSIYQPKMIENSLSSIGKNPLSRPEQLSLNEFILLYQQLSQI
jgi:16S rRNA (adenine1518-N6/adenine1519-N6)-dimethyltransferase